MWKSLTTSKKISLQFTMFSVGVLLIFWFLVNGIYFWSRYTPWEPSSDLIGITWEKIIDPDPDPRKIRIFLEKEFPNRDHSFTVESPEVQELMNARVVQSISKFGDYYLHYTIRWRQVFVRNVTSQVEAQLSLIWVMVWLIALGGVGSYLISLLFVKNALKKLNKLNAFLGNLDLDHLDTTIDISGSPHDEINRVSQKFNLALLKIKKQAQGLKDFVKNASHELKTPLMTISTLIDISKKTHEYEETLSKIKAEAKQMDALLGILLLITQLEEKIQLPKEKIDISESLESLLYQYQLTHQQKNLRITTQIPHSLHKEVNPQWRTRIVSNLLSNAFKFVPDGGEIHIHLTSQYLSIYNSGEQILPEFRAKIWERFWQAEDSHTDTKSFWLGLYLAQLFAQKQNFELRLDEKTENWVRFILDFYTS